MNYSDALIKINAHEKKDLILNDPFSAYSLLRDYIGNSFENKIFASRYLEINLRVNVFNIFHQYDVKEALDILKQAHKDLFSNIPIDEYKSVIKPIAMLYDKNCFSKKKIKKTSNWIHIPTNDFFYLDTFNVKRLFINSTIGNVEIKVSNQSYINIISDCESNIISRYKVNRNGLTISFTFKRKSMDKSKVEVYLTPSMLSFLSLNTHSYNAIVHYNCSNINVHTTEGKIFYDGISDKVNLETKYGFIYYSGKSNCINVLSLKGNASIKHEILKYNIDRFYSNGLYRQVFIRKKALALNYD